MFDIEEAGIERTPLRARLLAEADVVAITSPPTLAVRAAGTRRIQRRRVLQAASGAVAVCAVAGAVLAWSPGSATTVTPVGPATSRASGPPPSTPPGTPPSTARNAVSPPASHPPLSWPTNYAAQLPGYLHLKDLGTGWVGPYATPEQNVSPTLAGVLACAGSEGEFVAGLQIRPPAFRVFNRADGTGALVEAVYEYSKGQATYAMDVIRGTSQDCKAFGGIVQNARSVGDQSIVIRLSPNRADARTLLILVRRGDKIAFVSTSAPESVTDVDGWRDSTEVAVAAALGG